MTLIERLKNNKEAFGLMDEELQRVAEKIGKEHMLTLNTMGEWFYCHPKAPYSKNSTYRLHKDYVCPHPGQSGDYCSWCGAVIAPAKPRCGWVEYPVNIAGESNRKLFWVVQFPGGIQGRLCDAVGSWGFGGVKYKAPCECYGGGETDYTVGPAPEPCQKHGPWTLTFARFWEVKK